MAEEVKQTSPQVEQAVVVTVRGMDVEDPSLWHHLIFCEELENDGVVCCLCQQPVLACPAYKCLHCNFYQHKLCIDRPDGVDIEIEHKYWWKRHHLIFIQDPDNKVDVCSVCKDPTIGPAYKCSVPECTVILHKSCGELSNVIHRHPLHSEHALILQEPSSTGNNDCFFCRKNCSGSLFYRCTLCSFNLHVICASRRRINPDDCHQHTFLSSREKNEFTCESCGKETEDIAKLCSECGVLIHKECDFNHTIKTRSHVHSLFRTYSLCPVEEHDNVFCKICHRKINAGAYYCKKCDYIVHMTCAYRFEDKGNNRISATTEADATELVHLVEGINLTKDERAGSQEIKHFSHPQHNLILILSDEKLVNDMRCEACMHIIFGTPFYGCAQCNFFLHNRCAKLPPTIKRWRFHTHSLTLHSQALSIDGLFECDGCKRYRQGFTYRCDECKWYEVDIQCCLIPETLTHEGHQHLLRLINLEDFETCYCNACGEDYESGLVFMCIDCKFMLCLKCATLPLVAKYEFDTHLLKLSYACEDNSEEYYCLICERERHYPDRWFYFCVKCKFTAHTQCVIGKNPCIKFGKTYIDEEHREHPLTIVQKADHSPPCDFCNEPFDEGVTLECTQCKFNVHPSFSDPDCLKGVRYTSPDTASDRAHCDGSD